ncbi:MAG TPA: secretin N-terminal domain-containing protein [Candidatus Eisenbacteria bacterium]|nr:secretin N-terminal domain-containing protein [Candidatus Eisenbacteria bacterium]
MSRLTRGAGTVARPARGCYDSGMGLLSSALVSAALAVAVVPAVAADAPPSRANATSPSEARISVDFKDADIVDIVRMLSEVGNFQVVIDPGISCKLTLKLKEVPWDSTLDVALRVCGLGSESDGGIVRVAPVAKLTAEHQERRRLAEEQKLNRPLRTVRYTLSYARAAELAPLIKKFLSPRGDVVFDARTNTLIITDVD